MNSKAIWYILIALIVIIILAAAGQSSEDSYRKTLESGRQKYYTGQKMTKQEYNAVKGFNEWKSKQGEKTYDSWGG